MTVLGITIIQQSLLQPEGGGIGLVYKTTPLAVPAF